MAYFLSNYGTELLGTVLCALLGTAGFWLRRHLRDETKRSIAKIAVQFVEQVFRTLHGPEKLSKALDTARELLEKKGIAFDAREMEIIIEAALAEFNRAFEKQVIADR